MIPHGGNGVCRNNQRETVVAARIVVPHEHVVTDHAGRCAEMLAGHFAGIDDFPQKRRPPSGREWRSRAGLQTAD